MKILGIDYGKKRCGLALYDTLVGIVVPFGVCESVEQIEDILRREQIEHIVIGLPLGLDGKENEATKRVRIWGEQLCQRNTVTVDFFDERFTSVASDQFDIGVSRDEKAAIMIVEGWVERKSV